MKSLNFDKSKDCIAIIAPASKCADANLWLLEIENLLKIHGFKYNIAEKIFEDSNLPFVAANKENRINGLKQALQDPKVKIILTFRGGYGCTEIMLDCMQFKLVGEKILVGFSDITALHILFNQSYSLPTIHGSALTNILNNNDFERVLGVLKGEDINLKLQQINNPHGQSSISGSVTGGNLTILCNLIGTPLAPQTDNKILILEDVNEKGYHVHRHLIHLKNAGLLQNLKALVFGDFTKSDQHLEIAINDFCFNHIQSTPTFRAQGIGHGEVNTPFILGSKATIEKNLFIQKSIFKLI